MHLHLHLSVVWVIHWQPLLSIVVYFETKGVINGYGIAYHVVAMFEPAFHFNKSNSHTLRTKATQNSVRRSS
jgi:hypothetical protein